MIRVPTSRLSGPKSTRERCYALNRRVWRDEPLGCHGGKSEGMSSEKQRDTSELDEAKPVSAAVVERGSG